MASATKRCVALAACVTLLPIALHIVVAHAHAIADGNPPASPPPPAATACPNEYPHRYGSSGTECCVADAATQMLAPPDACVPPLRIDCVGNPGCAPRTLDLFDLKPFFQGLIEHETHDAILELNVSQSLYRIRGNASVDDSIGAIDLHDLDFDVHVPLAEGGALAALVGIPVNFRLYFDNSSAYASVSMVTLPLRATVNGTMSMSGWIPFYGSFTFHGGYRTTLAVTAKLSIDMTIAGAALEYRSDVSRFLVGMDSVATTLSAQIVPGTFSALSIELELLGGTIGNLVESFLESALDTMVHSDSFRTYVEDAIVLAVNDALTASAAPELAAYLDALFSTFLFDIPGHSIWCPLAGGCTGKFGGLYRRASVIVPAIALALWALVVVCWCLACRRAHKGGACKSVGLDPPSKRGIYATSAAVGVTSTSSAAAARHSVANTV